MTDDAWLPTFIWKRVVKNLIAVLAGVWLVCGLSASLQTKGSLVWFPVRAHGWVAGQVPSKGCARGNHTLMFLSLLFSLPPLSKNKKNKILKKRKDPLLKKNLVAVNAPHECLLQWSCPAGGFNGGLSVLLENPQMSVSMSFFLSWSIFLGGTCPSLFAYIISWLLSL